MSTWFSLVDWQLVTHVRSNGSLSSRRGHLAPEGVQQRLVHHPIDVLDVVIRLVGTMYLLLWLAGVDPLEDT